MRSSSSSPAHRPMGGTGGARWLDGLVAESSSGGAGERRPGRRAREARRGRAPPAPLRRASSPRARRPGWPPSARRGPCPARRRVGIRRGIVRRHASSPLASRTSARCAAIRAAAGVGLPRTAGELVVRTAQLQARDDRFPIPILQAAERALVPLHLLPSDRLLDRRRPIVGDLRVHRGVLASTSGSAQLVPDAVHQGLPQVGLERALMARLEVLDPLQRSEEGFLNKVLGIGRAPGSAEAGDPGPICGGARHNERIARRAPPGRPPGCAPGAGRSSLRRPAGRTRGQVPWKPGWDCSARDRFGPVRR